MNSSISIICRVCNSNNTIFNFRTRNYDFENSKLFDYYYCNDCKSIFLKDVPDNINKYYLQKYTPFNNSLEIDFKDSENLRIFKKFTNKSSVLELGVGNGNFLIKLNNLNYSCFCIEPFSQITKKLKQYKINVIESKLEDLNFSKLNFKVDIIYSWHSIEHLHNLEIFMKLCDKVLNKNGRIVLSTPNKNSLSYMFYGKYWYHLEAPRHNFLIDQNELIKKFKERNYIVEKSVLNYSSIIMSKYGWETSGYYKKKSLGGKYHSYLGKFLSYFMPYIEFFFNRTAQTTLILKK